MIKRIAQPGFEINQNKWVHFLSILYWLSRGSSKVKMHSGKLNVHLLCDIFFLNNLSRCLSIRNCPELRVVKIGFGWWTTSEPSEPSQISNPLTLVVYGPAVSNMFLSFVDQLLATIMGCNVQTPPTRLIVSRTPTEGRTFVHCWYSNMANIRLKR